ncbi:SHC-transforming protein 1 isoform X2 [Frankliniella occidentalis]|uniref:SHC-transforming protein 1 isoform X2 n=1 Tax=Frankliniella occidentalis TaxID=133901 RepID=A0A9C6TZW9_FRAOC|nr:SHC-transforming protein 1 isoform X2 [Frankliniella occidentalis]
MFKLLLRSNRAIFADLDVINPQLVTMPRPCQVGPHEPGLSVHGAGHSIVNKPPRGWLHSDKQISDEGITYAVRYIGYLAVNTSMKALDFETRSQVAKECINRVCEAASLKTVDKKRKVDKRVLKAIGERPIMDDAGTNVNLTISSSHLILTALETGRVLATHSMPHISFASGGDTDTLDFVAYVAKDDHDIRACYVLECGGGLAQDVITTVGQAFELRYKEFLTRPGSATLMPRGDDREYYNDLPGKVPPDIGPPPVPPLPTVHNTCTTNTMTMSNLCREISAPNLIDLNSEVPPPPIPRPEHNYVNDSVMSEARDRLNSVQPRDIFDMQPFNTAVESTSARVSNQRGQLLNEKWFHGFVSRQEAEALLTRDGDFLVRESQGSAGQFVLTGLQGGVKKHLLLIDPEGVVRTRDRMFESVSHLIKYHCENQLPIISAESALVLRRPVPRPGIAIMSVF